jgi:hypothetical protein
MVNSGGRAPQLTARDIRKLDFASSALSAPAITVREHVLLLVVDPIRAIILRDRCILVLPDDNEVCCQMIMAV